MTQSTKSQSTKSQFPKSQFPNPPILIAILLLALGLRVFLLGAQSLRGDEAYGVLAAGQGWAGLAHVLGSTDPHPPLYYALLSLWLPLAGHTEFALRFFSVAPSVLMVAVVYALGRRLFDRQIALIGAFLAAINPFYVWHAQDARMYTLLGALAALSALLMLLAWQRGSRRRGSRRRWTAYIAITALALYTHYFAALTLLVQNLLVLGSLVLAAHRAVANDPSIGRLVRTVARDPRTRPWVLAQVAVLLLYLPWLVVAAQLFAAFGGYVPAAGLLTILLQALIGFSLGPTLDLFAAFLLTLGFGMLFGIGLLQRPSPHPSPRSAPLPSPKIGRGEGARAARGWGEGRTIAALYVLVPVLLVAVLSQWRPMFHERYLIGITPFYLLILARGLAAASESFVRPGDPAQTAATRVVVRHARLWLGLLYLVAASGFALSNHYFDPVYAKSPDWRGMTAYLRAHERPGDLVIENTPETAFTYYYGLTPAGSGQAERVLLPETMSDDAADTAARLDALARQHRRLWLIPQAGGPWDPDGVVQSWLDTHCAQVEAHDFDGVGLALYLSPLAEPGSPSYSLDIRFGESIALFGYDLTSSQSTNLPTYHLTLYWRCLGPVPTDYTVFVHVVRADGGPGIYGQQDGPPARGAFPTGQWQPGQVVVDDIELAVHADAPAGAYTLAVGLYDPATGARLPATDAAGAPLGDHVRFGVIEVRR